MAKISKGQAIKRCQEWAEKNYNNGADTIVECWDDADWDRIWEEEGSYSSIMSMIKDLADVYKDQQQDAINSAF